MLGNTKKNSIVLGVFAIIILFICVFGGLYNSYGHKVVEDVYNGQSYSLFNGLIGSSEIHTLDFYLEKADILYLKLMFFVSYIGVSVIIIMLTGKIELKIKIGIFLFAACVALNSQFLSFLSPYIINDDVRQHTWWMRQFQEKQLFDGDLMAIYAKNMQPWGILALYYPLSFLIDPIVIGKILPPVLLGVSAVYFYQILKQVMKDNLAAILGACIYSITPIFLRQMVGGHARAFAFPLMIMFIFYFLKKDYLRAFILIVIQSCFYPMAAVLCGFTYFFSFIGIRAGGMFFDFDINKKKLLYFIMAFIISASALFGKQVFSYMPEVGSPVSRNEVIDKIEFYNERWPLLPTPSISSVMETNLEKGIFLFRSFRKHDIVKHLHRGLQDKRVFFIVLLLAGISLILLRKVIRIPKEVYYLLLSGIFMFKIADIFFLKLYSPRRYLEYSAPLVSAFIFVFIVARLFLLKGLRTRKFFQIGCFAFVLLNFNISSNEALIDMSGNKALYSYLEKIPDGSVVAGHPELLDGVPIFSKRKAFVAKDMSVPLFDNYWETVKKRTFDIFTAYYSEDPAEICELCRKNNIEYIIVDRRHYTESYISEGVYFEPFNSFVSNIVRNRKNYVLNDISDEYKIYNDGDIFVVQVEKFRKR